MRTMDQLEVAGKRVLVREDLNVPLVRDGERVRILDATRVDAAVPTLRLLRERHARIIVLSHLGRPGGHPDPACSLRPVAALLAEHLGAPVDFASDCIGEPAQRAVDRLRDGDVLLLENVRFHPGEERNDPTFARALAALGDAYVDDAFGTAHRAHASTEAIAHMLPSAAGPLMEAEIAALQPLMNAPATPYVCVIGGAKVKDKVGVLSALAQRVTAFCVGGGMANTLLAARGVDVGRSLRDEDLDPARRILALAHERGVTIHLPIDAIVSSGFDADEGAHAVAIDAVGDGTILDIGPATAAAYARVIEAAKTIVFNGPMGVYEKPAYRSGTKAVGEAIARATAAGATSVVGGGDAAAAAHLLGFADRMTHVSTGGGATLEFLEGKTLPGVAALQ
ncbi:MAG: phosphoglycerate kinase [Candidatus Tyrphobacter sp.]